MPSTVLHFPGRASTLLEPDDTLIESAAAERRAHVRRPAEEILWLDGIRLKYGPALRVIDLSRGGAQVETSDFRLTPGQTVVCELVSGARDLAVPARVVRCHVSRLSPRTHYRGRLAFKRALDLPALDNSAAAEISGDPDPVAEHRRLMAALRRRCATHDETGRDAVAGPDSDTLTAMLALLEAPAGRRAGKELARELSWLFRTLSHGLDLGEPPNALRAALQRRLRRVLPIQSIEMVAELRKSAPEDSLYFNIVTPAGQPAKLFVHFLEQQALTEAQFQLLKAAARLFALVQSLDHASPSDEPVLAVTPPADVVEIVDARPSQPSPAGVRVVVRYTDGRMVKGYCRDFLPERGYVEIAPPERPTDPWMRVPFGSLKAIFFVRDFAGDPRRIDKEAPGAPGRGRPVTVTFLDDEVLRGTTMNYQPSGPGFFVTPRNHSANNERVFVVARAIRHVQFA